MDPDKRQRLTSCVFMHADHGILITDRRGTIIEVNPAFSRITGYTWEEVVGRNPRLFQSGLQTESFYREMWGTLERKGAWHGEITNRRKDGSAFISLLSISVIRDPDGRATHYLGIFIDFTDFKDAQSHLERLAYLDPLTGLPNRTLLMDRMQQSLAHADRDDRLLAVCYVDIDGFKPLNDTHGHATGDMALVAASRRMKQTVRSGDTVARIGGDEFVLLLTDLDDRKAAEEILSRLLDRLAVPLSAMPALGLTASIGVTLYPTDRQTPEELIHHADQAMYKAKNCARGTYRFFPE